MDTAPNEQTTEVLKEKTAAAMDSATNIFSQIKTAISNFIDTKKKERMLRLQTEINRPQWGDKDVFQQGKDAKATNIAIKKPEGLAKKEPLLK
jgi:hypothetical protein